MQRIPKAQLKADLLGTDLCLPPCAELNQTGHVYFEKAAFYSLESDERMGEVQAYASLPLALILKARSNYVNVFILHGRASLQLAGDTGAEACALSSPPSHRESTG